MSIGTVNYEGYTHAHGFRTEFSGGKHEWHAWRDRGNVWSVVLAAASACG